MPDFDTLEFFETIEEAVANNDLESEDTKHIDKKIKHFENDNYAVLFYIPRSSGSGDWIYVVRFIVKEIDGTRFYSTPYITSGLSWETHKWFVNGGKIRGGLDEIGEIRYSIAQDVLRYFRIDDANFFWGVSQTERVRNLRIEGQLVTEVIEVNLDGETAFFWYFEDLKTDKKPFFRDLREYTEGEFIITMD